MLEIPRRSVKIGGVFESPASRNANPIARQGGGSLPYPGACFMVQVYDTVFLNPPN